MAGVIFWLWNSLGFPDVLPLIGALFDILVELLALAIEFLLMVPVVISWLIDVWFFYGWVIYCILYYLFYCFHFVYILLSIVSIKCLRSERSQVPKSSPFIKNL